MNIYVLVSFFNVSLDLYCTYFVKFTNLSGTSVCLSLNHTKTTITFILVKLIIHLSGASMVEKLPVYVMFRYFRRLNDGR